MKIRIVRLRIPTPDDEGYAALIGHVFTTQGNAYHGLYVVDATGKKRDVDYYIIEVIEIIKISSAENPHA